MATGAILVVSEMFNDLIFDVWMVHVYTGCLDSPNQLHTSKLTIIFNECRGHWWLSGGTIISTSFWPSCEKESTLTHCRLNELPYTIYWKSPILILDTSGWDLDIPREKKLNYLQTVETLVRRRILRRLIWACIVFQLPVQGSSDYNGLKRKDLLFLGTNSFLKG